MNTPNEWSGILTLAGVIGGAIAVYFVMQIKESTVYAWILGIVIMGILCVSMFGTSWLH